MFSQAWHIFRKDLRLLWPFPLAVSLMGAGAMLTRTLELDMSLRTLRADQLASFLEFLMPFAWAIVTARVVLEDPLPGTDQFWLTRPYRRGSLALAKLLFVWLGICVPKLLIDLAALARRGFAPFDYLGELFWMDLVRLPLGLMVIGAVAAVTRGMGQFGMTALASLVASLFILESLLPSSSRGQGWLPPLVLVTVLWLLGAAVLWMQYRRRWTTRARVTALIGLLAAYGIYAVVPRSAGDAWQMRASKLAPPTLKVTLESGRFHRAEAWRPEGTVRLAVPVKVDGWPDGFHFRSEHGELNGHDAHLFRNGANEWWLFVTMPEAVFERLKAGESRLAGRIFGSAYQAGPPHRLNAGGAPRPVPLPAVCQMTRRPLSSAQEQFLNCDFPPPSPRLHVARALDEEGRRINTNDAGLLDDAWFSLGVNVFPVTRRASGLGSTGGRPVARVEITPLEWRSSFAVAVDLAGVRVGDYVISR